jgi:hypothetical protein
MGPSHWNSGRSGIPGMLPFLFLFRSAVSIATSELLTDEIKHSCGDVAEPLSIEDVANPDFWNRMIVDDSDEDLWEGPLSMCPPEGGHAREWLQDEPLIRQQGLPDGAILVVPDSPGSQADDNPVSQEIENEGL